MFNTSINVVIIVIHCDVVQLHYTCKAQFELSYDVSWTQLIINQWYKFTQYICLFHYIVSGSLLLLVTVDGVCIPRWLTTALWIKFKVNWMKRENIGVEMTSKAINKIFRSINSCSFPLTLNHFTVPIFSLFSATKIP